MILKTGNGPSSVYEREETNKDQKVPIRLKKLDIDPHLPICFSGHGISPSSSLTMKDNRFRNLKN